MVSVKELEEKKAHLISMRPFEKSEEIDLRNKFIVGNTTNVESCKDAYTKVDKLLCINDDWNLGEALRHNSHSYFYYELLGIMSAYNYIQSILNYENKQHQIWEVTEEELQFINRLILDKFTYLAPFEKGFYRKGKNDKFGDDLLPNRSIFMKRLKRLISWYSLSQDDLFQKISLFHLKLEKNIHPFYDGNGRTGRVILNIELARHGYPLISLKYNNFNQYYLAFDEYRNNGNVELMKNLVMQEVDRELSQQILMKQKI
jgi:Fic family protein